MTKAKILVVDDDPSVRYFLEKALVREGYEVVAVASGAAAVDCFATQEFDLALIDLKMKGVSGLEVLAALHRQWPASIAIILTAHASLDTAVEALRHGAHDYLFKPCATVDLRASVRSGLLKREQERGQRESHAGIDPDSDLIQDGLPALATQSPPAQPPAPAAAVQDAPAPSERFLRYQGLIVDPIRHLITLNSTLLELSPTEFSLLAYLVAEHPRVVSPQELVREIQGYAGESWEVRDTLRSHIYHLRRKIRAATGHTLVRTVRGIGYTLQD